MSPPQPATPGPWRGRLVVLAGVVLVSLNLRVAVASVSPILDVVRGDVALSTGDAGLLGAAPVVAFSVFGALAPVVGRRWGLEVALVAAMLLSAAGELLRATVTTAPAFLLFSVVALAGMGMGNVLVPPLVKRYFPDRIGGVTAAYAVGMAVSASLPPLVAVPLAESIGWRQAVGAWAVVGLLSVVPWLLVVLRSAAARRRLAPVLAHVVGEHPPRGRVWRVPLAWAMAVTFAMNTANVYVVFAWLPEILGDAGVGEGAAGGWLALFGLLGFVSALVVPPVTVRTANPWWLMILFTTLYVVAYIGLLVSPTSPLWLWVTLLGTAPGSFPLVLTLVGLRTRTADGASALSGFVQGLGYALAAAGPVAAGMLREATGDWRATIGMLLAAVGVLAVAGVLACRPVMLEDRWGGEGGRAVPTGEAPSGARGTTAAR
ncbi:MAG TPA: MFS transporter [Gemmatimonadaceae bacterium]|nr:MFS transporter [Gemmatimonadaceae bacterium]